MKQRLYTYKMKEGTLISDHIDEFNRIITDMKNIDLKIEDEDQALILLCSLPPTFDNFVNSMLYGRESITLEIVENSLKSADLRGKLGGQNTSEDQDQGLVVRGRSEKKGNGNKGRGRSKSKSSADKSQIECFYCHKKGHYKNECLALKNKKNKDDKSGSASVVEQKSSDEEESDNILAVTNFENRPLEEWIWDTACTSHMTPLRDWFTKARSCFDGK